MISFVYRFKILKCYAIPYDLNLTKNETYTQLASTRNAVIQSNRSCVALITHIIQIAKSP